MYIGEFWNSSFINRRTLTYLNDSRLIGSNEQLENTERCNGIVQDEPEVIMQTTEKIEILFQRIKLATSSAAHIYGNVLCQLTNDLVPPKELLTKVIKEFLTVSQPHCDVIAKVVFQVKKNNPIEIKKETKIYISLTFVFIL